MEDLNFITPLAKTTLDTKVALKYFKAAGSTKNVAAGKTIFKERRRSHRIFLQRDLMYFLVEGEVDLSVKKSHVGVIRSGEIFGEMTLITGMTRTATAKAKTDCRLYTLDKEQLQVALRNAPEFGLLLMSIMITRLRDTIAALGGRAAISGKAKVKKAGMLDKKLLKKLEAGLDESARISYPANKVIMTEGQAGVLMYIVQKGSVDIAIHNKVVATVEAGGMFGEMALISRAERVASAITKTDCVLFAIHRNVFLDLVAANPEFGIALLGAVGNRARFMAAQRT